MNYCGLRRCVSRTLFIASIACLASEGVGAQNINDYDYFKRVAPGKERLIIPAYRGVPAKTRRLMKRAITQSYRVFGRRPIANTYALYWHTKKSNLTKVATKWCSVAGRKGADRKRCMSEGGGWDDGFKTVNLAAAVFETARPVWDLWNPLKEIGKTRVTIFMPRLRRMNIFMFTKP